MSNTPSLFIILFFRAKASQLLWKPALMWAGIRKACLCMCWEPSWKHLSQSLCQEWCHRNKVTGRGWQKRAEKKPPKKTTRVKEMFCFFSDFQNTCVCSNVDLDFFFNSWSPLVLSERNSLILFILLCHKGLGLFLILHRCYPFVTSRPWQIPRPGFGLWVRRFGWRVGPWEPLS